MAIYFLQLDTPAFCRLAKMCSNKKRSQLRQSIHDRIKSITGHKNKDRPQSCPSWSDSEDL